VRDDLEVSESITESGLSPKQSLLTALLRLADCAEDTSKTVPLSEKEMFIYDLEQILKVLTFKETCLLVFPALELFAVEADYLKTELFR
jgi:hypothetical protein